MSTEPSDTATTAKVLRPTGLAKASIAVVLTRAFSLGAGVMATVALARFLSPEDLGRFTSMLALVTIVLSLADLGVRQAVTYLLGQGEVAADAIVGTILVLLVFSSAAAIAIVAGVWTIGADRGYGMAAAYALAAVPFVLTTTYVRGVSLALGWIGRFNRVDLIDRSLFLGLAVALTGALGLGLIGATLAYTLAATAAATYSVRLLARVAPLRPSWRPQVLRRMIRLGAVYAVALFVLNLNYRLDVLMLERMVGAADVGVYGVGVRLAELLWQVPSAIAVVLFSASARTATAPEAVARTAQVLRIVLLASVAIALVAAAVAGPLVRLAFGPAFVEATAVWRLLLPGVCAAVVFKILNADLAGRGRPLFALQVYAATLVLNVALNLWWIPNLGIHGAALASTVSYAVGALWFAGRYAALHDVPLHDLWRPTRSDASLLVGAIARRRRRP